MSLVLWGIVGWCLLFLLMFLNMPIGFAMVLIGFAGICVVRGTEAGLSLAAGLPFEVASYYILSVIPLFILMGFLAARTGLSSAVFSTINKWIGHWRGGLAIATVAVCSVFAAMVGGPIAPAATMAAVALPEMRRYKYSDELSLGCIAGGANLGILIPPSLGFVLYAILTELSIGRLFIAGILPGLLLTALFVVTIFIIIRTRPQMASPAPRSSWSERLKAIPHVGGALVIIVLVLGGIYGGIFTPTEAAAVGVFGVLALGLANRQLTWQGFIAATRETAILTGLIFILIIGAFFFGRFMCVSEIPLTLVDFVQGLDVPRHAILAAVLIGYILLGFVMDIMSLVVIVAPILHPVLVGLGFDPTWLAVVTIITVLVGMISPPVGMVVYTLSGIVKDVPMFTIFRGAFPFLGAMLVCLIIVVVFPQIALLLPNLMRPG